MSEMDQALANALDRLVPPPMRDDFAARVLAAAQGAAALPVLPPLAEPRGARRGWARTRNWALGLTGLTLVSAAAAASGVLGESIQNLPVISVIAHRIAPKPKPVPKIVVPSPKAQAPASRKVELAPVVADPAPVIVPVPEPLVEPLAVTRDEVRREVQAQAIAQGLARRAAMRAARGEEGPPGGLPPRLRERLAQMPPDERKALMMRVRQIRQEQMSGSAPPPERAAIIARAEQIRQRRAAARAAGMETGGEQGADPPAPPSVQDRPRWRDMTQEQRQQWRAEVLRRRDLRLQRQGRAEPVPDEGVQE